MLEVGGKKSGTKKSEEVRDVPELVREVLPIYREAAKRMLERNAGKCAVKTVQRFLGTLVLRLVERAELAD